MYPAVHARSNPERPAYILAGSGQVVTYRELDDRSNQCAQLFRSLGLEAGDAIAFCLENHPAFFEIAWAAMRSGLCFTPISTQLTPAEVEYIVDDCGAKVFITSVYKKELAEALASRPAGIRARLMLGGAVPRSARSSRVVTCCTPRVPQGGPRG